MVRELLRTRDGSVRFVYRQFPLDGLEATANTNQGMCADARAHGTPTPAIAVTESADVHAGAGRTAIAAYCARTQGRFWEYHHLLCSRPDAAVTCDALVGLAREVGIDDRRFVECLDDPAAQAAVQKDFEAGVRAGLYGTPTFFINGGELVAPSKEVLERTITRALEKSHP